MDARFFIKKKISASINFSDSACEIWLDLQERYQRKNRPHVYQIHRELSNLSQNQDSISTYFLNSRHYGSNLFLINELALVDDTPVES